MSKMLCKLAAVGAFGKFGTLYIQGDWPMCLAFFLIFSVAVWLIGEG